MASYKNKFVSRETKQEMAKSIDNPLKTTRRPQIGRFKAENTEENAKKNP